MSDKQQTLTAGPRPTCGQIVRLRDLDEGPCGKPAVAILDAGAPHGYPVCTECARFCHPARLTRLDQATAL